MAKKPIIKPKNPFIVHAKNKKVSVEDPRKKDLQRDKWDRHAKHKGDKMAKVDEGVLGMSGIPGISRMKELAGIKESPEPDKKMRALRHIKELEEIGDIDDGQLPMDNLDNFPEDDFSDDLNMDDEFSSDMPDEFDMPIEPTPEPIATALPAQETDHTPAFNSITMSLDDIQNKLEDIKVSEYKEVLAHLKTVYQTVRDAGFTYLQEGRKFKE